jgi:ABC-type phosphate/phosphonate transport system substrate-binding protein
MLRILTAATLAVTLVSANANAGDNTVYKIGIGKNWFRDVPPDLVSFAGLPFQELVKDQTGLNSEIVQDTDAMTVAKKIDAGEFQFGVLQGYEYAWAQEKYSNLKPLVSSVDRPKKLTAFILVRSDDKAESISDLKGKKLVLATTLKDYPRLFLEKQIAEHMSGGDLSTSNAETVHEGIQKVIGREADVTVADFASWNYFQKLYPGASKNLRVLAESDEFPATVLIYKKGAIPDNVLKKIHDGFLSAHESKKSSGIMTAIHIERFDEIPAGFDNALKASRKGYPTPLAVK